MSEKVQVYPAGIEQAHFHHDDNASFKAAKRLRWWVLIGTFCVLTIVSLLYIWTRPAIYQSESIIHFSYPSVLGVELADVPVEQITLNQQRLTSFRVMEQLSLELSQQNRIILTAQQLNEMLSASVDTNSRTINLYATGAEAQVLEPVLDLWITLYMTQLGDETVDDTHQQLLRVDEKIRALEQKIIEQRAEVEAFARDNQIVSAEREENRTLNQIQGLSASLDQAQADQADTRARLSTLKSTIAAGDMVIHPSDGIAIDRLQSEISTLEAELTALAEVYTEVYMQRDPEIVNKQRNLAGLKTRLQEARTNSQARYLQETELAVLAADETYRQLQLQLEQLNGEAQSFNENLAAYNRELDALSQLEEQSQALRDQRTELEVQRPYEAVIKILEQPFVPSFPIGPDYKTNSLIAMAGAAIFSVFALMLYSFIVRRTNAPQATTNYTLVSGDPRLVSPQMGSLSHAQTQGISYQESEKIEHQPAPVQRLLSEQELQELYLHANPQTRLVLGLALHGVSQNELVTLQPEYITSEGVVFAGPFARDIPLAEPLQILLEQFVQGNQGATIWPAPLTLADLDAAIINTAHDGGLSLPDQVNLAVIRHTYLTYLVAQGARLNDLQGIAGYTEPSALSHYRNVNRQQDLIEVSDVKIDYPLNW